MKNFLSCTALLVASGLLFAASDAKFDPLPAPSSGSAITSLKIGSHVLVFSLMGMGAGKTWDAVSNSAHVLNTSYGKWSEVRSMPGSAGRLGAGAAGLREQVFVLGGYLLDPQGGEQIVPDVEVYSPLAKRWYRGPDLPKPVSDFLAASYRDRYIYVVGGRSIAGAVRDVQLYDSEKQEWLEATPLAGPAVFGHAGAVVGDAIVYVDGAQAAGADAAAKFRPSTECWEGKIDRRDPRKIEWTKLPPHPGTAHYGIAAGGSEKEQKVYFSGGSENPYDHKGIGFDGQAAEPSPTTFVFDLRPGKWETLNEATPDPGMDSGLIVASDQLMVIGGMKKNQRVSAAVAGLPKAKAR